MSITTTTHLTFSGEARAALEFYRDVFDAELKLSTYGDFGMPGDIPGADHIVFGEVTSAGGFRVMAYDTPGQIVGTIAQRGSTHRANGVTVTDQQFFLSVRGDSLAEVQGYWDHLAVGATIVEPIAASAWSPGFGMLTDRFGVTWILDVAAAHPDA